MPRATLWLIVALVATGCKKEEPSAYSPLALTPTALDFGPVSVDNSESLDVTLTNGTAESVEVLSVTISEGSPSVWTALRPADDILGSGDSVLITVSFSPDAEGAQSGKLQVRTSDDETPSLFVSLDGEGTPSTEDVDQDGYSTADGDCNDDDPAINPGATEVCNGVDDDCDGSIPADENNDDGDEFRVCEGDCDDGDELVYPGAPEICDYKDNDCVGGEHDLDDLDGDGFAICDGDCNDEQPTAFPGGIEVCDLLDNNCDGVIDDIDVDGDGYTLCTGDCDDDVGAHPTVVAEGGLSTGDGTLGNPYGTLADGIANVDPRCEVVRVEPGSYQVTEELSVGSLTIVGAGLGSDEVVLTPVKERQFSVISGAALVLENLTLAEGVATTDGGAVSVVNSDLTLRNVWARDNSSDNDGGAVSVSSGSLTVENGCIFTNNASSDDGGAVAATSSTYIDRGGSAYVGNSGRVGGAIFLVGGLIDITDASFDGNAATDDGGAISMSGVGSFLIERGRYVANTSGLAGGALSLRDVDDDSGFVRNLELQSNVAGTGGGGIALVGLFSNITVANNTVVDNTAGGHGGGIWVDAGTADEAQVWSNIVAWSEGSSGLYVGPGSGASAQYNTVFQSNSGLDFGGDALVDVDGNIVRDPMFVDFVDDGLPGNDDLDLQAGSPERDDGPPAPSWNDSDGSLNDRGHTGGPGAL